MAARALILRVQDDVAGFPPGSTASLVVDEEPPPAELTVMARVFAFFGEALLMVDDRFDGRGWCLPGGHIDAREDALAAAVRETYEEARAVAVSLRSFGYHHLHVTGTKSIGSRYPHPDRYQAFFLARVERLDAFVENDDVAARALFAPSEAREVPWVRDRLRFYEHALARSRHHG